MQQKDFFFFFCHPLHHFCKSNRRRIRKLQRQIKKKATGKFLFAYPSSSAMFFALLLICGRESMVHYNWPLSSCRWHTVSAVNIISAFAYLRSFSFLSFLLVPSFRGSFRDFDIPAGNYHPRSSLSICADWHNMEKKKKKVHVWLSFSLLLNKCRTISQPVKKTVFVWLQWTPMQISVATECSLLSSSLSSLSRLHTPAAPWVE